MTDITYYILNFHGLVVNIFQSLASADASVDGDDWDSLVEMAFVVLIKNVIADKFGIIIPDEYECWGASQRKIQVTVNQGADVLVGERSWGQDIAFVFKDLAVVDDNLSFFFVEFSHPGSSGSVNDLNYVTGVSEDNRIFCAKKEDCRFFVDD